MQAASKIVHAVAKNYCRRVVCKQKLRLPVRSVVVGEPQSACYSSAPEEVVPPPPADLATKVYSPKIEQLVDDIGKLTLLEVADLNELLKKTLNIQDAPMMAMGAMPVAAAKSEEEEEDAAPKREKVNFTVKLTNFDAGKKVQLIKEIKNVVEGLNLVQAKKFVESVPQVVRADITKEEAEKLKEALSAVGAEVEIE